MLEKFSQILFEPSVPSCNLRPTSCFCFRKLQNWWKRRGNVLKKFRGEELDQVNGPLSNLQWEADYYLTPIGRNALFYEYLEMGR